MAGGKGQIRPEDGVQFGFGNKAAEKWTEEKALELGEDLIKWISEEDLNDPARRVFINGFLVLERGLNVTTVNYLAKKFSSFSNLYERAKQISEYKLAMYGLAEKTSSQITKFALANNHGWTEKKDITQTIKELPKIKFTSE